MEKKIKLVDGQIYEYVLYDRVDPYSDILKQKLEPFDFNNPPINPRHLAISLIETMVKYRGLGMAANQVGLPYRVFVMGAEGVGFACFNPEIVSSSGEETYEEGCISFPGLFLKIKRASSINVRFIDMNGAQQEKRFDGLTARIFQHELDHLNGINFISKVSPITLQKAKQKVKQNVKKLERGRKEYELQKKLEEQEKKLQEQQALTIKLPDPIPVNNDEKPVVFEYNSL